MSAGRRPDEPIDALVRAHLARQAEGVDAAAMLARVRACGPRPARRAGWWRAAAGLAAVAAAAAVFLGGGHHVGPARARASPEALVREAKQAHALPVDRCYLVQTAPAPNSVLARYPHLAQPRETRLWTRGDRFWIRSTNPERQWAWGRDEHGRVWLALSRRLGVRYEPHEVPRPVAASCDVCSLRVETLLDEVLRRFELVHEPGGDEPPATHAVRARLKPGQRPRGLRGALLEVDAETHVLRRLVLHRTNPWGRPLATVTHTLIEAGTQPDDSYQLEGHLEPDTKVLAEENHPRRAQLLEKFFRIPPRTPPPHVPPRRPAPPPWR